MTHAAFENRHCYFFADFCSLWTSFQQLTSLATNTELIVVCILCFPVWPLFLSDVMHTGIANSPHPIGATASLIDSQEHCDFAALLREAGDLERLQSHLHEQTLHIKRQHERLNHMITRMNRLILEHGASQWHLRTTRSHRKTFKRTTKPPMTLISP